MSVARRKERITKLHGFPILTSYFDELNKVSSDCEVRFGTHIVIYCKNYAKYSLLLSPFKDFLKARRRWVEAEMKMSFRQPISVIEEFNDYVNIIEPNQDLFTEISYDKDMRAGKLYNVLYL